MREHLRYDTFTIVRHFFERHKNIDIGLSLENIQRDGLRTHARDDPMEGHTKYRALIT